jgi:hypothetical protein
MGRLRDGEGEMMKMERNRRRGTMSGKLERKAPLPYQNGRKGET